MQKKRAPKMTLLISTDRSTRSALTATRHPFTPRHDIHTIRCDERGQKWAWCWSYLPTWSVSQMRSSWSGARETAHLEVRSAAASSSACPVGCCPRLPARNTAGTFRQRRSVRKFCAAKFSAAVLRRSFQSWGVGRVGSAYPRGPSPAGTAAASPAARRSQTPGRRTAAPSRSPAGSRPAQRPAAAACARATTPHSCRYTQTHHNHLLAIM